MFGPHRPRARFRAFAAAACTAALGATLLGVAGTAPAGATPTTTRAAAPASADAAPTAAGNKVVGYFTNWGVYQRNYHVRNIETSGSADKLTHINYAFGNVTGGKCAIGDSYADYEKAYTADQSVDGVADTWDQDLRGNFNQLRKLKKLHPDLKVIWSFGGWTWSGGFGEAAKNPAAFAESCYNLVED
ncbi:glycosyl hydrolase family 18 protein, partial [Streptomyces sp. NPDC006510]|uniref:glycosyl hydrolase family 18 protein n=1 Tax=Streptomyces sp. NPDC006510 TaxID=3155600 RepID=UPI0033AE6D12